uniref:Uncharacterized protein n=1 Tax=Setaria italica TaxID=4555 RepID=K3XU90_SETIT
MNHSQCHVWSYSMCLSLTDQVCTCQEGALKFGCFVFACKAIVHNANGSSCV